MKIVIHQGEEEIDPMSTCDFGLTYVVKYLPIIVDVPPFGQMWVDPWTTVESLQDTLSQVHYGSRANVRMVCNGSLLDATTTIAFAAKSGTSACEGLLFTWRSQLDPYIPLVEVDSTVSIDFAVKNFSMAAQLGFSDRMS